MRHRMNLSKEFTLMSDFCQYENGLMERSSYRDRVQQLRHLNPVRPGALLPLRREESD